MFGGIWGAGRGVRDDMGVAVRANSAVPERPLVSEFKGSTQWGGAVVVAVLTLTFRLLPF